ncbi:MAG: hypothetical protein LUF26_07475 [Firmicutes bacterium]|nr:hypothetical protein [Bacillota bacterium]
MESVSKNNITVNAAPAETAKKARSRFFNDDSEHTYANILCLNAEKYKDISLVNGSDSPLALSLSVRSLNALNRIGCLTADSLLSLTPRDLRDIRNLGKKSILEIENALIDFPQFTTHKEKKEPTRSLYVRKKVVRPIINAMLSGGEYSLDELSKSERKYLEVFAEAADKAGNELCAELMDEDKRGYIGIIADALMEFRERNEYERYIISSAKSAADGWDDEIRSMSIEPLMKLCEHAQWKPILKDFEPLIMPAAYAADYADLVKAVLKRKSVSLVALEIGLNAFQEWMKDASLKKECKKLFECGRTQDRIAFDALYRRTNGATLAEIAAQRGITRERVRQLEKKAVSSICQKINESRYNIFGLISACREGERVLQRKDVTAVIGEERGSALWYCVSNFTREIHSKKIQYDKNRDAVIVFGIETEGFEKIVDETIEALPDLIETSELKARIKAAAKKTGIYEKLFTIEADKKYYERGIYSSRDPIMIIQMCERVLKKSFPDGYKIANKTDSKIFVRTMRKLFNTETTPHAIDSKIMDIGVLIDRGKYIHSDYINADKKVIDAIYEYVEKSSKSAIAYSEIYAALKDVFEGTVITNRYALQGVMKLYGCPYESRRDYIVKTDGANMADELNAFVERAGCARKSEIFAEFPGSNESNLAILLTRCPEVITLGNGEYMHSHMLSVAEVERGEIREYLDECIRDLPVSARYLQNEFTNRFPKFMENNDIKNHEKLFGVLRYMFSDDFYFSHCYIAREDKGSMTNRSVVLMLLEGRDTVGIKELAQMCRSRGIHYLSISYMINMILPEFVRADAHTLIRSKKAGLKEKMYSGIADMINSAASDNGGYIAASRISDYSRFPKINIPWTPFLLESVADIIPKKINAVKIQSSSPDIPHSIFVSGEYAGCDWTELVVRTLKAEHEANPFKSKTDVLKWLRERGLCASKYPLFLEKEQHVYFDERGNIQIK